ncbi:Protein translocase subunit [Frankliniella fusca]|uniref:Protein translocase subunit n=1 Tax=Frankliniella fusca TaxID=407009 RepID=A0AAE1L6T3_9NEOP|nr:Protein translocase subunit [Frankliniella fusca]
MSRCSSVALSFSFNVRASSQSEQPSVNLADLRAANPDTYTRANSSIDSLKGFTREYTERSLNNCTNILASGSLDVVLSHTLIISELGLNAATGVLLFMQSESRSTRRQSLLEASESANFESEKKNSLRSGLESHGWTLDGLDSDTPNLVHIERFQVAPSVTTPSTRKPLFSNKIIASSTIFVSSSSEAAPLQSLEGLHLVVDPLLLHMLQLSHLQRH